MVKMAYKPIAKKKSEDWQTCPRCGEEALTINVEGMFVKWLTCPKCKFKKLIRKEEELRPVRVVSLKEKSVF